MSRRPDPWSRPREKVHAEIVADIRAGLNVDIRPTARASGWSPSGIYARVAANKAAAVKNGRKLQLTPEGAAPFLGITLDRSAA
jgi:hypothetical protein